MIIYGKNCILRAFDLKDVKSFYAIAHDDDVKSFVPYAYPENMHEAFENVYAYSCGDMKNDFYLVIERDGEIVGAIISVRTNEDSLDTSAFISKNYRGMGIMTDAMNTFVKWIKENIPEEIYIDVMAQYFPAYKAKENKLLNRKISKREYELVLKMVSKFENGYIQELSDCEEEYVPKFDLSGC